MVWIQNRFLNQTQNKIQQKKIALLKSLQLIIQIKKHQQQNIQKIRQARQNAQHKNIAIQEQIKQDTVNTQSVTVAEPFINPFVRPVIKPVIRPVIRPVELKPVAVKPIVVKPVAVKPIVVKPVEVKPVAVKPVEVKPVEVKPVEVTPAEVTPAEEPDKNKIRFRLIR